MNSALLFVLGANLIFVFQDILSRHLLEKGWNAWDLVALTRWLFFPFSIVLIFTFKSEYLTLIFEKWIWVYLLYTTFLWPLWMTQKRYLSNTTPSLSAAKLLDKLTGLPFIVFLGIFFLGDWPTTWLLLGGGLVILSLFLQPDETPSESRVTFRKPWWQLILLFSFSSLVISVDLTVYRSILKGATLEFSFFFISLGMWLASLFWWGVWWFRKRTKKTKKLAKQDLVWIILLPTLSFLVTFLEGLAYREVSVLVMALVGVGMYGLIVLSDLWFGRFAFSYKLVCYVLLSLSGLGLIFWSL